VETTLNQPEVFKVYRPQSQGQAPTQSKSRHWQRLRRSIVDLPRRAEVSRAANYRYLQAIANTQGNVPLLEAVRRATLPVRWQGHRYRGINPLQPQDAALLQAIGRGEWALAGFRNRDIRCCIYPVAPRDGHQRRRQSAAIGRRLRLLRAHGIIRKTPRTHRYTLTPYGRNLLTAIIAAQQGDTQKLTTLAA
jgi:hypothetical protein